jgi:hypothetical protein
METALVNHDNELLDIMRARLNEEEMNMYITNFYLYLNYDATKDFVVDFDSMLGWIEYSHKANAKAKLVDNFQEGVDYIIQNFALPYGRAKTITDGAPGSSKELGNFASPTREAKTISQNSFAETSAKLGKNKKSKKPASPNGEAGIKTGGAPWSSKETGNFAAEVAAAKTITNGALGSSKETENFASEVAEAKTITDGAPGSSNESENFAPPRGGAKTISENRGGSNKETILLTVNCFKEFCMEAKTKQAKKVRQYYIKIESIQNEYNFKKLKLEREQEVSKAVALEKERHIR